MSAAPVRTSAAGRTTILTDNALVLAAGVQLVAGVITSKLAATLLGAAGVGTFALVQAVANIVALCSLGTGEALVREWGRRHTDPDVSSPPTGRRSRDARRAARARLIRACHTDRLTWMNI